MVNYLEKNNIGFIEFDQADSKVNLLTAEALRQLDAILEKIKDQTSLDVVVVLSKKKDVFIAGADIKEIEGITQAEEGAQKSRAGQDILNKLEDLPVPTIAVIDGAALGGGCELALACRYRLATFNEKVRIGLPEVNLGILPGFGGTYRLPRMVGLAEGLKMILAGKPVDGRKALKIGLVDKLVPQAGIESHLLEFIKDIRQKKLISDKYSRRSLKGLSFVLDGSLIAQSIIFQQSRQSVSKLTRGFYPAPLKAIEVVKESLYAGSRRKGMDIESKAFGDLAVTTISKNLVQVFYLSEKYRKLTIEGAEKIAHRDIRKCGILGAGIMGGGIAQLLSSKGIATRLKDVNADALAKGLHAAHQIYADAVRKQRVKPNEMMLGMARISPTIDYSGFGNADIVIEAVVENMDVKKKVFAELDRAAGKETVLATNTSALSVTEMANQTQDPSKVVGIHFFNPVHRMPLVEIVRTQATSDETLITALNLVRRLDKTPIVVKDSCGFVVNRILLGYINEAGRLLEEGNLVDDIDGIMTDFGMPMGPFMLSDEVGLDVGIKVLHTLAQGLGDRFKPTDIFEKVYANGFLGKKSGKGFYTYGKKRRPNPDVVRMLEKQKSSGGFDRGECLKRMVYLMINEAGCCLKEGIVDDPGAIDVGMIFGTGFPAFRGGLLRYADSVGIAGIVEELKALQQKFSSDRFRPCEYLLRLENENRGFYS